MRIQVYFLKFIYSNNKKRYEERENRTIYFTCLLLLLIVNKQKRELNASNIEFIMIIIYIH